MTKDQIDELSKTLIDKIYVTAINNDTMKLSIKLKTDQLVEKKYERKQKFYRCSGITTLTMNPEQRYIFSHKNRTKTGHISNIIYSISICI